MNEKITQKIFAYIGEFHFVLRKQPLLLKI